MSLPSHYLVQNLFFFCLAVCTKGENFVSFLFLLFPYFRLYCHTKMRFIVLTVLRCLILDLYVNYSSNKITSILKELYIKILINSMIIQDIIILLLIMPESHDTIKFVAIIKIYTRMKMRFISFLSKAKIRTYFRDALYDESIRLITVWL